MSAETSSVTSDFIFGTMATDDLRLAHLRNRSVGVSHGDEIVPHDPPPGVPVTLTVRVGPSVVADSVTAWYTLDDSEPTRESSVLTFGPVGVEWDTLIWGYRQIWQATMPPQPSGTLVSYRIAATDAAGTLHWADHDPEARTPTLFAWHVDDEDVPAWVRDAVIYHVFIDRFSPDPGADWLRPDSLDGIWGGTIRGITARLPYLLELGVTCLWLSPIFPSPTHHGYDATDYTTIEPRLGTMADLDALIAAAHESGIRVILDFVANHVSNESRVFREAQASPDSSTRDWFTFDGDGRHRSFFGVESMPQLDTDAPGARAFLIDAATFWLRRGVDGFRLDYANGPSHAFWSAFRAATRDLNPESITIGEVVETAEVQRSYAGRLDGTLDFLLLQQMRAFFAFDLIDPAAFDAFLNRHLAWFGSAMTLPSFLDNHDMNRFLWVANGDVRRLKLAALCQFTLPHPPIIYYGTEAGLSQWHDLEYPDGSRRMEESRTPMPWSDDQDSELLTFYRRLIALRRAHMGTWRGRRTPIARHRSGLYAVRLVADARDDAVVVLNRGDEAIGIDLPDVGATLHVAIATEPSVRIDGNALHLPSLAGAVLFGSAASAGER